MPGVPGAIGKVLIVIFSGVIAFVDTGGLDMGGDLGRTSSLMNEVMGGGGEGESSRTGIILAALALEAFVTLPELRVFLPPGAMVNRFRRPAMD